MTERTCGTCKLCCKVMQISEIDKPPGPWCQHARPRNGCRGCSIYPDRPEACSSFRCGWLNTPEMADDMRPDRIGAVLVADGKTVVLFVAPPDQHVVWRRPNVMALLSAGLKTGFIFMITDGTRTSTMELTSATTWKLTEMKTVGNDGPRKLVEPVRVIAGGRL